MLMFESAYIKNLLWVFIGSTLFYLLFLSLFVVLQLLICITYSCCRVASLSSLFFFTFLS